MSGISYVCQEQIWCVPSGWAGRARPALAICFLLYFVEIKKWLAFRVICLNKCEAFHMCLKNRSEAAQPDEMLQLVFLKLTSCSHLFEVVMDIQIVMTN